VLDPGIILTNQPTVPNAHLKPISTIQRFATSFSPANDVETTPKEKTGIIRVATGGGFLRPVFNSPCVACCNPQMRLAEMESAQECVAD
jgi:hypothetical protein